MHGHDGSSEREKNYILIFRLMETARRWCRWSMMNWRMLLIETSAKSQSTGAPQHDDYVDNEHLSRKRALAHAKLTYIYLYVSRMRPDKSLSKKLIVVIAIVKFQVIHRDRRATTMCPATRGKIVISYAGAFDERSLKGHRHTTTHTQAN